MALILCPDCSTPISDLSPACLRCGRPSAPASRQPSRAARRLALLAAVATCAVVLYEVRRAHALGIPTATPLVYSGSLSTFGAPDNASHSMVLGLFVAGANDGGIGSAACVTNATVTCVNGQFSIPLSSSCTAIIQANPNLQTELTVDNTPMGFINVTAVPYAVEAGTAATAATASSVSAANITTGAWTPFTPTVVSNGSTHASYQYFSFRYLQVGTTVFIKGTFVAGQNASGAGGSYMYMTLPIPGATGVQQDGIGTVIPSYISTTATTFRPGWGSIVSGNENYVSLVNEAGNFSDGNAPGGYNFKWIVDGAYEAQ